MGMLLSRHRAAQAEPAEAPEPKQAEAPRKRTRKAKDDTDE